MAQQGGAGGIGAAAGGDTKAKAAPKAVARARGYRPDPIEGLEATVPGV